MATSIEANVILCVLPVGNRLYVIQAMPALLYAKWGLHTVTKLHNLHCVHYAATVLQVEVQDPAGGW